MKYLILILVLCSFSTFAHDDDELAVAKFAPRFGGKVSAVEKEGNHHHEAVFMSEVLVSDDNKVRLYFYDVHMKDTDLKNFPAELVVKIKSKSDQTSMVLKKSGKNYIGDLPVLKKKPFDARLEFMNQKDELHIEFKALD